MIRSTSSILIGVFFILSGPLVMAETSHAPAADDPAFPILTGPYLGQPAPGELPTLFAPGIVSTDTREWGMAPTPDGREIFFGLSSSNSTAVLHTSIADGRWSPLAIAEFSGEFDDFDLTMAPDGNRVYFTSARPITPGGEAPEFVDIWFVDRTDDGWSEPFRLPEPINTPSRELYPSASSDGLLIFFSNRPGGFGGSDLYSVGIRPDGFGAPVNLGPNVNTDAGESDACISPDGSFVVFTSGRDGGFGRGDLYVTFKLPDGAWSKAQNLGEAVNTEFTEFCPSISGDGRFLFFTSNRQRQRPISTRDGGLRRQLGANLEGVPPDIDIYWMDASFIEQFRPEN